MTDLFGMQHGRSIAARKISGQVAAVLSAAGADFITTAVEQLDCDSGGIIGDHHYGLSRKAGGREPWYPRGTLIRNDRQISLICAKELDKIARIMGLATIAPEWIGANIVVKGIADFTLLPACSVMFFENGLSLKLNGLNAPCKIAGSAIARYSAADDPAVTALNFVKAAKYLRGQTGWVEREGRLSAGETFTIRVPEQIGYRPD